MKLLVIVLCLFSERYLIHAASFQRFNWYNDYFNYITNRSVLKKSLSPWMILFAVNLPIVILTAVVLFLLGDLVFGFAGLLLHLFILLYCLGPQNPFYPISGKEADTSPRLQAGEYFSDVNGQLFAVLFWYIVSGPVGIVFYRTISLSQQQVLVHEQAKLLQSLLDWLPARITALLYLLVGSFQRGRSCFVKYFFTSPGKNKLLLSECGLAAAFDGEKASLPAAEEIVGHAVIVFLVFLALFTIIAWL